MIFPLPIPLFSSHLGHRMLELPVLESESGSTLGHAGQWTPKKRPARARAESISLEGNRGDRHIMPQFNIYCQFIFGMTVIIFTDR
jgi:hypothetical protein